MKRIIFIYLLVFASVVLNAQWDETLYPGVPLKVGVDTEIWDSKIIVRHENNVTKILAKNEIVIGGVALIRSDVNGIIYDLTAIKYDDINYITYTKNLSPNKGRLSANWISSNNTKRKWIISYYLDVLQSQNRDTFLKYEKAWIDFETAKIEYSIMNNEAPPDIKWYNSRIYFESLVFYNAVIIMGGFGRSEFFITDIISFNTGYKISIIGDRWYAGSTELWNKIALPFPRYSEHKSFDLIFIPDGDYMDVYLDNLNNKFATFAYVDTYFLEELEKFVEKNNIDLSRITWPRRGDGSMDYPPPDGVDLSKTYEKTVFNSNYSSTHKATENLRLRDSANTSSLLVTTLLKDTEVQIIETGASATINDITATWVKVISSTGYTGWCFGGYLEEIADNNSVVVNIAEEELFAQKSNDKNAMPLPLLLAIIIGGVAVGVGVVLILRKKK